jgi:hypothetical protein
MRCPHVAQFAGAQRIDQPLACRCRSPTTTGAQPPFDSLIRPDQVRGRGQPGTVGVGSLPGEVLWRRMVKVVPMPGWVVNVMVP